MTPGCALALLPEERLHDWLGSSLSAPHNQHPIPKKWQCLVLFPSGYLRALEEEKEGHPARLCDTEGRFLLVDLAMVGKSWVKS